jgi:predicted ABC-type ATPase
MSNLYIIAGCNGAGKTTASFTVLPEILNCKEFVNADNIAAGLSPFNPESVAFESGRIMLKRINQLMSESADFAFETTLSTRSYVSFIKEAIKNNYEVTLVFFWLNSPELAKQRVAKRVSKGGHHIPNDVVERRYYRGIQNLIKLYIPLCDSWIVINNEDLKSGIIIKGKGEKERIVINSDIWNVILKQSDNYGKQD